MRGVERDSALQQGVINDEGAIKSAFLNRAVWDGAVIVTLTQDVDDDVRGGANNVCLLHRSQSFGRY